MTTGGMVISPTDGRVISPTDAALEVARDLARAGVAIFTAPPGGTEFTRPPGWSRTDPAQASPTLAGWRPPDALCAVMGGPVAVVDVDVQNRGDVDAVRALLGELDVVIFAEVRTPGGGRHYYVAGHPDLPTAHNLVGFPGVDLQSFGSNVFLPGTNRPKYDGAGYVVMLNNLAALTDGGDPDGADALAGWVAEHRVSSTVDPFEPAPPWDGTPPDRRQAAYLTAALERQCDALAAMGPNSGRNLAVYTAALKCGSLVTGAGLDEALVVTRLVEAATACGLVSEDGIRSVQASVRSGLRNGRQNPRAVPPPNNSIGELAPETGAPADPDAEFERQAAFNREVQDEAHRIRVREGAKALVTAERASLVPVPPFDAGTLGEVLARPAEPPFRVDGLLPAGGSLLVVAPRKTGKTTFKLNLTRSLLTGEPFLGRFDVRPVDGSVAFLNYEVSGAQVARWADDVGIDRDRLFLVNLRGRRNPLGNVDDREQLVEMLAARSVNTVIVDPFGRAYDGASQNDAGEVGAWLANLDRFAADVGATETVLSAHAGWSGERTRGSSALEDWADSIVTLVRDPDDESQRFLKAIGRDVEVDEDRLVFDPATRLLRLAGTGSRKATAATRRVDDLVDAVVEIVTRTPAVNVAAIRKALRETGVAFSTNDDSRAITQAVGRGLLRVEPGPRGAKLHHLAAPPTPPTPHPLRGGSDDPLHPLSMGGVGHWSGSEPTHSATLPPLVQVELGAEMVLPFKDPDATRLPTDIPGDRNPDGIPVAQWVQSVQSVQDHGTEPTGEPTGEPGPLCTVCGAQLLLIRPGRDVCGKCDSTPIRGPS